MRTFTCVLCTLLLTLAVDHQQALAGEVDGETLISDFISPQMPESRRDEILKELAAMEPSDMQSQLKKAITEEAKRTHALRLAIEFQVPGLWSAAAKQFETDEQGQVIVYGLTTLDKGAEKFLIERWLNAALESEEFQSLQSAFQKYGVDPKLLDEFMDVVESDGGLARADGALKVLYFQSGWRGWDKQEFIDAWPDHFKKLKKTGGAQKIKGRDMLRRASWAKTGATNWGRALRLEKGAGANNENCAPPGLGTGSYSVTARLWLESLSTQASIAFNSDVGGGSYAGYVVEFGDGKWSIETGGGKTLGNAKVPKGKWFDVRWDVVQPHPDPKKGEYLVSITVNGTKAYNKPMNASGTPCRVLVGVETGSVVLGAVDYVRE